MSFVHLHVHSEYSILDGCGKQIDFIRKAKKMNQPAIAFTEHGSLRGVHKLHENSAKENIKPIYGIEFYVSDNHKLKSLPQEEIEYIKLTIEGERARKKAIKEREVELGIRKRYHITALAETDKGLKNLYKLSSIAWTDGFYIKPRIDLDLLFKYGDGLIILSGCMAGVINNAIINNNISDALDLALKLYDRWPGKFFLELMPNSISEQIKINRYLEKIGTELDIPLVTTCDAHYINKSDWETHEVLLCVNTKTWMSNPYRWKFPTHDFWLQSKEEIRANYKKYHPDLSPKNIERSMNNTLKIADMCKAQLHVDTLKALVPEIKPPKNKTGFNWLCELVFDGWEKRNMEEQVSIVAKRKNLDVDDLLIEYHERIKKELKQIKEQNVSKYFLAMKDLFIWTEKRGIMHGPGRGSVGGCLIAFLLGLTEVDPIEHDLIFERFLNPDRLDMPDIDTDFEDRRRGEILEYLKERWGHDRVAQISTIGRMTGKQCLRDVSRTLSIPLNEVDTLCNSIISKPKAKNVISESFDSFEPCKRFNKKHPQVLRHALKLEDQARNLGLHAAGILVSPLPLTEFIPLETRSGKENERLVCSGFDMRGVEAMGLMKIDILGLRTLSVSLDCLDAIKKNHGVDIDLNKIDLNDRLTLSNFTDSNFLGVFQFDTSAMEKTCSEITFDRFDDIVAAVALVRPGTSRSGLATEFIKRKKDPSRIKSIHPVVDKICDDALGIMVYQEHAIRIFIEVAGYTPGEADRLRKLIAKSKGTDVLEQERKRFIEGAVSNGFKKSLAKKLINQLVHFGSYSFNKAHSTAYAMISFQQMWLKVHYPIEFFWATLVHTSSDTKIMRLISNAKKMGIKVERPNINISKETFVFDGEKIISGLRELKGVGTKAIETIIEEQPFDSFSDFCNRVNNRKVHKGVIIALVKAGVMDELIPNKKWFLDNFEQIWKKKNQKKWATWIEEELVKSKNEIDYDHETTSILASSINPMAFDRHPIETYLPFLNSAKVNWFDLNGSSEIWTKEYAWLRGIMTEIKINQIGDFHFGPPPNEDEQWKMGWGKRYANIGIEDINGEKYNVKIGPDIFREAKPLLDKGKGTPVASLVSVMPQWKKLDASILFDVSEIRLRNKEGKPYSNLEKICFDFSSLMRQHKKNDLILKIKKAELSDKIRYISGETIVANITEKVDKNYREMAFIGLYGFGGYYRTVCFASNWHYMKKLNIKPGDLVNIKFNATKQNIFIINARKISK